MPCTLDIDIHLIGGDDVDIIVSTDLFDTQLIVDSVEQSLTLEIIDAPTGGGGGTVAISGVADNRLERKPDGLYVRDRLDPDPVSYYLLSRG